MAKKNEEKKRRGKSNYTPLSEQVVKAADTLDPHLEDHVTTLLSSIQNLKLEKLDLTTPESAREALPLLDKLMEQISKYENTSRALRVALESAQSPADEPDGQQ